MVKIKKECDGCANTREQEAFERGYIAGFNAGINYIFPSAPCSGYHFPSPNETIITYGQGGSHEKTDL